VTNRLRNIGDRTVAGFLAVLVLLTAVPGAVMGIGWIREDWLELNRIRNCGIIDCPGPEIGNRPVMTAIWDMQFSLFGDHPAVIYWLLNIMLAVTAVALYSTFRRMLPQLYAAAIVFVWAVFPTHQSLQHWASVSHNVLALMLCALGVERLLRKGDKRAIAFFVVSIAIYESVAPIALLAVLAAPLLRAVPTRFDIATLRTVYESDRRFTVVSAGILIIESVIILALQLGTRSQELAEPTGVFWSNFTFATDSNPLMIFLGICILLGSTVALARFILPSLRPSVGRSEWLVFAGLTIMVAGALPFMSSGFDGMFRLLGDRANQTAAIGGAMVWIGIASMIRIRAAAVAFVGVAVVAAVPIRLDRDGHYAHVTKTTPKAAAAILAVVPAGTKEVTVVSRIDDRYSLVTTKLAVEAHLYLRTHHQIRVRYVDEPAPGVPDPLLPFAYEDR
jgi:hypothetical protein